MDPDRGAHGARAPGGPLNPDSRDILATFAGLDPVSGAGIGADTAVMRELGFHAVFAATAVVAQNTRGVRQVWPLTPEQIGAQWRALIEDVPIEGVKIGMLGSAAAAEAVAVLLEDFSGPVVLDPVLASGQNGARLGDPGLAAALCGLLARADVVTPNVSEAEALSGIAIDGPESYQRASERLLEMGAGAVLMKGGHMAPMKGDTVLWRGPEGVRARHYPASRRWPFEVRGTGCHLSSAICAFLALGHSIEEAVGRSVAYMEGLWASRAVSIGGGARVFWQGRGRDSVAE